MNHLYYGDNLLVLRDAIATESVDLIYLRGGGGDKWGKEDGREAIFFLLTARADDARK